MGLMTKIAQVLLGIDLDYPTLSTKGEILSRIMEY